MAGPAPRRTLMACCYLRLGRANKFIGRGFVAPVLMEHAHARCDETHLLLVNVGSHASTN